MNARLLRCFLTALLLCALLPTAAAGELPITQAECALTSQGELPANCSESSLGDLTADAVRSMLQTDFALIPAGCLSGTLEAGSVFESDLQRIIPEDAPLGICKVTAVELKALLEHSVAALTTDEGERIQTSSGWDGFLQTSGFSWNYDVSAPSGNRVLHLRIEGQEVDLSDQSVRYSLAAPVSLFDGTFGYPQRAAESANTTLRRTLADYCAGQPSITKPETRASALGTASYPLMGRFPILAIAAACIIIALFSSIPRLKEEKYFSFAPSTGKKP